MEEAHQRWAERSALITRHSRLRRQLLSKFNNIYFKNNSVMEHDYPNLETLSPDSSHFYGDFDFSYGTTFVRGDKKITAVFDTAFYF